ncbi:MAG: HIT family protein [Burkholderiales bacterium]|nr:HIT family protein [Burkholderiales bacterium]
MNINCLLCDQVGGQLITTTKLFRLVLVNDENYPGYIRLILNQHHKELTDIAYNDALLLFTALYRIETAMRKVMQPDKVNIVSLGNVVMHAHWHIIPRFINDLHFPNSTFGLVTHSDYKVDKTIINRQQQLIKELQSLSWDIT